MALIQLPTNTTWELPADVADTARGEKRLRSIQGVLCDPEDSRLANNGTVAQVCIVLAILDLLDRNERPEEKRTGTGDEATSKTVLRDMSGDALLFTIQTLWPVADRDESMLRREVQYLIDHGAERLRDSSFHDMCETLIDGLSQGLG